MVLNTFCITEELPMIGNFSSIKILFWLELFFFVDLSTVIIRSFKSRGLEDIQKHQVD